MIKLNAKDEIILQAEIQQQRDLIYVLLTLLVNLNMSLTSDIGNGSNGKDKFQETNVNITFSEKDQTEVDNLHNLSEKETEVEMNNFKFSDLK